MQVTGLPDEATKAWLVGALGAVQAAPALGARLQLPEPATPLAAAPPTFESDETTRTAPSKRRPVLRFADGAEVVLAGRMLFGRDPSSSPALGGATPSRSMIPSMRCRRPTSPGARGAEVWIEDLRSTNGTALVVDGVTSWLEPGTPTRLGQGGSVRFGTLEATLERQART